MALWAHGCVIDSDDLCGPNQVIWGDDQRCICAPGTAYTPTGCVPCGANEVASPSGCICSEGYVRPAPGEACIDIPVGIGTPCVTDTECLNPAFAHCQSSAVGGYCTSAGCSSSIDCSGGYICDTTGSPPFCKRPPVGAGKPCTSPADCAGTEALLCDMFVTQTCLVQDCNLAVDDCFPGSECCDVSAFGLPNLCVAEGACQQ